MKNSVKDITPPGGKNKKYEIDAAAADLEWDANTDERKRFNVKRPPAPVSAPAAEQEIAFDGLDDSESLEQLPKEIKTMKDAAMIDTIYAGRLKRLKYEQEMGVLVDSTAIKTEWTKIVSEAKTKLLAVPSKAKANIPHLTSGDVAVIDRLVREALSDIADART